MAMMAMTTNNSIRVNAFFLIAYAPHAVSRDHYVAQMPVHHNAAVSFVCHYFFRSEAIDKPADEVSAENAVLFVLVLIFRTSLSDSSDPSDPSDFEQEPEHEHENCKATPRSLSRVASDAVSRH